MMPFIVPDKLWQSGVGGSIPSMVAYVLGILGIVRLVGGLLDSDSRTRPAAHVGAWVAAFAYGANPNLIYMQATALTEPLYLAFFIWTVVYFAEFLREPGRRSRRDASRVLRRCAYCVACAEMTRYDGWFLAGVVGAIVVQLRCGVGRIALCAGRAVKFLAGIAVAPALLADL